MENDVVLQKSSYSFLNGSMPLFEVLNFSTKHNCKGITKMNQIVCMLEGKAFIVSDIYPKTILKEKEALFLPIESRFEMNCILSGKILIISLDPFQSLYNSYSIDDLFKEYQKHTFERNAGILKIRYILSRYLESIVIYLQHDLFNNLFYEIKIKELLFILYSYYEKKELCDFFKPILNNDFVFASFILTNWSKVRTVKQLADLSTYCETGFNKKFKKVFGVTPYKWMNERKAARVMYDIINSDKSFKEIAEEYNFNSQQQFNDYCMRNFNKTPGNIRKR